MPGMRSCPPKKMINRDAAIKSHIIRLFEQHVAFSQRLRLLGVISYRVDDDPNDRFLKLEYLCNRLSVVDGIKQDNDLPNEHLIISDESGSNDSVQQFSVGANEIGVPSVIDLESDTEYSVSGLPEVPRNRDTQAPVPIHGCRDGAVQSLPTAGLHRSDRKRRRSAASSYVECTSLSGDLGEMMVSTSKRDRRKSRKPRQIVSVDDGRMSPPWMELVTSDGTDYCDDSLVESSCTNQLNNAASFSPLGCSLLSDVIEEPTSSIADCLPTTNEIKWNDNSSKFASFLVSPIASPSREAEKHPLVAGTSIVSKTANNNEGDILTSALVTPSLANGLTLLSQNAYNLLRCPTTPFSFNSSSSTVTLVSPTTAANLQSSIAAILKSLASSGSLVTKTVSIAPGAPVSVINSTGNGMPTGQIALIGPPLAPQPIRKSTSGANTAISPNKCIAASPKLTTTGSAVAPSSSSTSKQREHATTTTTRTGSNGAKSAAANSQNTTINGGDSGGSKVYKCRYCGKMFNRKFCRERHERLHTGIKPYSCEVCDEKFIRLEDKKRHVRSSHHAERTNDDQQANNSSGDTQDDGELPPVAAGSAPSPIQPTSS